MSKPNQKPFKEGLQYSQPTDLVRRRLLGSIGLAAFGSTLTACGGGGSSQAAEGDAVTAQGMASTALSSFQATNPLINTSQVNPVLIENANPGSANWQITQASTNGEIEGYASATSIAHGGVLNVYVSTSAPQFTYRIYRMGYYGGAGGRLVSSSASPLQGVDQTALTAYDPEFNTPHCSNWSKSFSVDIPGAWVSGVFLIKLTTVGGAHPNLSRYIPFIVRSDRASAVLMVSCTTTSNAYNEWGLNPAASGYSSKTSDLKHRYSLYCNFPCDMVDSKGVAASIANTHVNAVSFNRPIWEGLGTGNFITLELPALVWLEQNGYDVSYADSLDMHEGAVTLSSYGVVLSVGHDEYYTYEMRGQIESAIAGSAGVAFWGANPMYWQVRMGGDSAPFSKYRNMVCYKMIPALEPKLPVPMSCNSVTNNCNNLIGVDPWYAKYAGGGAGSDYYMVRITARWRDPVLGRPEQNIVGQMYVNYFESQAEFADWQPANTDHWVYKNTGLTNKSIVKGLIGFEYDKVFANNAPDISTLLPLPVSTPANLQILANSTVNSSVAKNDTQNTTIYQSGAGFVFSAGTETWSWGLSDVHSQSSWPDSVTSAVKISSAAIQRMSANLIDACLSGVTPGGPRVAFVNTGDALFVNEGNITSYMNSLALNVAKVSLYGDQIAILTTSGEVYVRNGLHGAPWVLMSTRTAKDVALDNARVGILYSDATLEVTDGALVPTAAKAVAGGVSAFAMGGNCIAVIESNVLYVKAGAIDAAYQVMASDASQVAISDTGRIAYVTTAATRDVLAVDGGAQANPAWVWVSSDATQVKLSGTRIGVLQSDGNLYVKEGALDAAWVTVSWSVASFDLTATRVGVCQTGGAAWVKEGGLSTAWTQVSSSAGAIALSSAY